VNEYEHCAIPSTDCSNFSFLLNNNTFNQTDQPLVWWTELLTTSHEVPGSIPVLPWEFSLAGEDPHSDHGLGSL
jgi:hypothetical protein